MTPLLSVVIANYNYGRFLESAIGSVLSQQMGDKIEIIICDAASSDSSVEVIKKYANGLPPNTSLYDWHPADALTARQQTQTTKISWWCSEKDKGQADAFNKGFFHATGRFGCWLNADDLLLPNSLAKVCGYIEMHPKVEWISGGTVYFRSKDSSILWMRKGSSSHFHYWNPGSFVGGPSSFFRLDKLREVGGFDVDLRFMMDIDLWWKFTKISMRNYHLPEYFWGFRIHEDSKTSYAYFSGKEAAFKKEGDLICARYSFSRKQKRLGANLLRLMRVLSGNLIKSMYSSRVWRGKTLSEFCNKEAGDRQG